MRILLATFLLLVPLAAQAHRVISVADGDSLTVQVGRNRIKLRLAGIDAPEIRQAFGPQARQSLRQLCSGKDVQYDKQATDRFGRSVATVRCDGFDAGRVQVERGMAWTSGRSSRELKALEAIARGSRIGLWSASNPVPPWRFRHGASRDAACHVGPRGGRYQWVNGRKAYGC